MDSCAPPAQVLSTYNSAWGSGHWASVSHRLMPTVYHPPANIGGRAFLENMYRITFLVCSDPFRFECDFCEYECCCSFVLKKHVEETHVE